MNIEQRLIQALRTVDRVEASSDLWSRVVHSIEEDRQHRRRVRRAVAAALSASAAFVVATIMSMTDGIGGRQVTWQAMEVIETTLLVAIAIVVAPAIRRFGRGYASDLWPAAPDTATALLRLLDIAYALVLGGYIMLTATFDRDVDVAHVLGGQLADASHRVGGLILIVGLLHAVTIGLLPLVALVSNSTRRDLRLPRWIVGLLVVLGLGVGLVLLQILSIIVAVGVS